MTKFNLYQLDTVHQVLQATKSVMSAQTWCTATVTIKHLHKGLHQNEENTKQKPRCSF